MCGSECVEFDLTNYLYDGMNLLEEVDSTGNVLTRYTQGTNVDEPLSQLTDAPGSILRSRPSCWQR